MILLDGKATSQQIKAELKQQTDILIASGKRAPHLVAVLVGNNGASETYVAAKIKACEEVGFKSTLHRLPDTVSEQELLKLIQDMNSDEGLDGFIIQLPLPKHISEENILQAVDARKDVDGFHPQNVGRLTLGLPTFVSATPAGIMELLARYYVETAGKHCVVIGRSNIVGTPVSLLMSRNTQPGNATVTLCHSRTKNIEEIVRSADIVIAAIGKPEWVQGSWIKEGAVVIDVGITRMADASKKSGFRLAGDVHFESAAPRCSFITPVPGGVGPMTIVSLLKNTLKSYNKEVYP
ncbi:MAG: bifunctional 5,10-methylene-tetrahydrofolate dehydrogenase/5,10-methylene-tetrahydrofolate cyclohydrolase [Flavobacteriales bacterium]|nr:bifunctional 5,10-methylene-tetrahydrofolate dehydrogenase/5,10-methylene-tetrahydrofolate cyclohydrolase [Flavobacteriales bacterium]